MRLSEWAAVRRAATVAALCVVLTAAPGAGHGDVVVERAPATALPGWAQEFSRLPDHPSDDAGASWRHDPALSRAFASPDVVAPTGPDWIGLTRDTALLLGYQAVATFGVIYMMPEDISRWPDVSDKGFGQSWVDNVQDPSFDHDAWWLNYVMHPYFGAVYYTRARERGFKELPSFLYSAFASTMYEFGPEAFFEKPSIQDLIVTPVAGAVIGAFVFEPIRRRILSKPDLAWYDHVGLVLTDPVGALNSIVERIFGIKSTIRVQMTPPHTGRTANGADGLRQRAVGLQLSVPWN
jgi:hypothetical protein